jgi:hypothetical protein
MGQIRGVVLLLDIPDPFQRLLGRERFLRQDRGHKQQRLPERQGRRPFFTRSRARTRT